MLGESGNKTMIAALLLVISWIIGGSIEVFGFISTPSASVSAQTDPNDRWRDQYIRTLNEYIVQQGGVPLVQNESLEDIAQELALNVQCGSGFWTGNIPLIAADRGYERYPSTTYFGAHTNEAPDNFELLQRTNGPDDIATAANAMAAAIYAEVQQRGYREIGIGLEWCDGRFLVFIILGAQPSVVPIIVNNGSSSISAQGQPMVSIPIYIHNENARPDYRYFDTYSIEVKDTEGNVVYSTSQQPYQPQMNIALGCGRYTFLTSLNDIEGESLSQTAAVEAVDCVHPTPEATEPPSPSPEPPTPTPETLVVTDTPTNTPTTATLTATETPTQLPTEAPSITVEPPTNTPTPETPPPPTPSSPNGCANVVTNNWDAPVTIVMVWRDDMLTIYFETEADCIWLYGLTFHWDDQEYELPRDESFKTYYENYTGPISFAGFPSDYCIQLRSQTDNNPHVITVEGHCNDYNTIVSRSLFPSNRDFFWSTNFIDFTVEGNGEITCRNGDNTCSMNWDNRPAQHLNGPVWATFSYNRSQNDRLTLQFDSPMTEVDVANLTVQWATFQRYFNLSGTNWERNGVPQNINFRNFTTRDCLVISTTNTQTEIPTGCVNTYVGLLDYYYGRSFWADSDATDGLYYIYNGNGDNYIATCQQANTLCRILYQP